MNISNVEYHRLKMIERKYKSMKDDEILKQMLEDFKNNLLLLADHTPLKDWPKEFHSAFVACKADRWFACQLYMNRRKTFDGEFGENDDKET